MHWHGFIVHKQRCTGNSDYTDLGKYLPNQAYFCGIGHENSCVFNSQSLSHKKNPALRRAIMISRVQTILSVAILLLTVSACGGGGGSESQQTPSGTNNSAPVAFDVSAKTNVDESLDASLNGQDADGDSLTYSITELPMMGTVEILDGGSGAFRFTPDPGAFGSDLFRYRVNDGTTNSAEAAVAIVINRKPVAQALSLRAATSRPKSASLSGSDDDADTLVYQIISQPSNGTLQLLDTTSGDFSYQANAGFEGSDSFTYRVSDGFAESPVQSVSLTVNEWIGTVSLGTPSEEQIIYGLEIDEQRNLYVAHATSGAVPGAQSQGGLDFVLSKLDPSGGVLWQHQWGTSNDEVPYQIARDSVGNIYVTVIPDVTAQTPSTAAYVLKYDKDGNQIWSLQLPDALNISLLYRMTVAPSQSVYITALDQTQGLRAILLKVTPNGVLDWAKQLGSDADDPADPLLTGQYVYYDVFPRGLAVDNNETIYVALTLYYEESGTNTFTNTAMLATLDGDGTILSRIEPFTTSAFPDGSDRADLRDLRFLPNGNLRVSGNTSGGVVLAEIDSLGSEIWSTSRSVAGENRYGFRGVVTADGDSIVTGMRNLESAPVQDDDVAVYKFDSNGVFLWEHILSTTLQDGTTSVRDSGGQPVSDTSGDIYMAITSEGGAIEPETNKGGGDIFIMKLDGSTGEIIESR